MPLTVLATDTAAKLSAAIVAAGYTLNGIACPKDGTEMRDIPDTQKASAAYGSGVTSVRIVCTTCGAIRTRYL